MNNKKPTIYGSTLEETTVSIINGQITGFLLALIAIPIILNTYNIYTITLGLISIITFIMKILIPIYKWIHFVIFGKKNNKIY